MKRIITWKRLSGLVAVALTAFAAQAAERLQTSYRTAEGVHMGADSDVVSPDAVLTFEGQSVDITAMPFEGQYLEGWYSYPVSPVTTHEVPEGTFLGAENPITIEGTNVQWLAAHFGWISYRLRYTKNGTTTIGTVEDHVYTDSYTIAALPAPATGHHLPANWTKAEGKEFQPGATVADGSAFGLQDVHETGRTVVLNVNEIPNAYKVSYAIGAGAEWPAGAKHPDDAVYGTAFTVTDPVLYGHKLKLWSDGKATYASKGGETTFVNLTPVAGATVTLTAEWEPVKTHVTFDNRGAAVAGTESMDIAYGTNKVDDITCPSDTDRLFRGYWTAESGGTMLWDADGKWCGPATWQSVDAEMTVYAHWLDPTHVTFNVMGATQPGSPTSMDILYGATPSALAACPSNTGKHWEFLGYWTEDGEQYWDAGGSWCGPATWDREDAELTVYARWNKPTHVVFNEMGADKKSGTREMYILFGANPDPITRPDYTDRDFLGYWTGEYGGKQLWTSAGQWHDAELQWNYTNEEMTVYAHWQRHTFHIDFDANGGSGEMAGMDSTCNVPNVVPTNGFARTGYTFVGWKDLQNDTTYHELDQMPTALIGTSKGDTRTLTALWATNTYWLAFDPNGGALVKGKQDLQPISLRYDEPYKWPADKFAAYTRGECWAFDGWSNTWNGAVYRQGDVITNVCETAVTNRLVAVWASQLTELSRAIHCQELNWCDVKGSPKWTVVTNIVESGVGIETNTCARAWQQLAQMRANASSSGRISFAWRLTSNLGEKKLERGDLQVEVGSLTLKEFAAEKDVWYNVETNLSNGGAISFIAEYNSRTVEVDQVVWTPDRSILHFDANGGTEAPDDKEILLKVNANVQIPWTEPTRDGFVFKGWQTNDAAEAEVDYRPGGWYAPPAATLKDETNTLTAVWTPAPPPKDEVTIPKAVEGLIGNDTPQTGVPEGEGYTITGHEQTVIGTYVATATLTNTATQVWSDGTTAPKKIVWSINEKTPEIAVPVAIVGLVYDGTCQKGVEEDRLVYSIVGNVGTNAAIYIATATPNAGFAWKGGGKAPTNITWSIARAVYDMSGIRFTNETHVADGRAHSLEVSGTLPEGVTNVWYTGNGQTEPGSYTVTAHFDAEDTVNHMPVADRSAVLTIVSVPPPGPEPEPVVTNAVPTAVGGLVYSGACLTGVVEGVGYGLAGHVATNAGTYTAVATLADGFVWEGGSKAPTQIVWSVAKATYDMSGVTFPGATVAYDAQPHSLAVVGTLPAGVTVSYAGNGQTEVGTYTVTAMFAGDAVNYEPIADRAAVLTIVTPPTPTPPSPAPVPTEDVFTGNASYIGWLTDADGKMAGTVSLKAGKMKVATGEAQVSGSIVPLGGKKVTLSKRNVPVGEETPPVDADGLVYFGSCVTGVVTVTGTRCTLVAYEDQFKSSDRETKAAAKAEVPAGTWTFALVDADKNQYGLTAAVAAKTAKTKITGVLPDSVKLSVTVAGVYNANRSCLYVPVAYSKRDTTLGFILAVTQDKAMSLYSLAGEGADITGLVADPQPLADGQAGLYEFVTSLNGTEYVETADGISISPNGVEVLSSGTKLTAEKTVGSVKAVDGKLTVSYNPDRQVPANLAKLKLKYTAKTGAVTGSFQLYRLENGKLKKDTANINGVLSGSQLLGHAAVKKTGLTLPIGLQSVD